MKGTIEEINAEIKGLETKLNALNNNPDHNKERNIIISKIKELKVHKKNIADCYVTIIQNAIIAIPEETITSYANNRGTSIDEARSTLFNNIIEKNSGDPEAFYNALVTLQNNGINQNDIDDFNRLLPIFIVIKQTLINALNRQKISNREKLDRHDTLQRQIDKAFDQIKTYNDMIDTLDGLLEWFEDDNLIDLAQRYKREQESFRCLDEESLDLIVESNNYECETGLNRLKHTGKRISARKKAIKANQAQKEQRKKVDKIYGRIARIVNAIWNSMTKSQKQELILYTDGPLFCSEKEGINTLINSIINNEPGKLLSLQTGLKQTVYNLMQSLSLLLPEKKELEPLKDKINSEERNLGLLLDETALSKEDKETYLCILQRFPFLNNLSVEDLMRLKKAQVTNEGILLTRQKGKILSLRQTK